VIFLVVLSTLRQHHPHCYHPAIAMIFCVFDAFHFISLLNYELEPFIIVQYFWEEKKTKTCRFLPGDTCFPPKSASPTIASFFFSLFAL